MNILKYAAVLLVTQPLLFPVDARANPCDEELNPTPHALVKSRIVNVDDFTALRNGTKLHIAFEPVDGVVYFTAPDGTISKITPLDDFAIQATGKPFRQAMAEHGEAIGIDAPLIQSIQVGRCMETKREILMVELTLGISIQVDSETGKAMQENAYQELEASREEFVFANGTRFYVVREMGGYLPTFEFPHEEFVARTGIHVSIGMAGSPGHTASDAPDMDFAGGRAYKTLELKPGASEQEIKSAFRRLAVKHHPDRNPNDPSAAQKFGEVKSAYNYLTHPSVLAGLKHQTTGKPAADPNWREKQETEPSKAQSRRDEHDKRTAGWNEGLIRDELVESILEEGNTTGHSTRLEELKPSMLFVLLLKAYNIDFKGQILPLHFKFEPPKPLEGHSKEIFEKGERDGHVEGLENDSHFGDVDLYLLFGLAQNPQFKKQLRELYGQRMPEQAPPPEREPIEFTPERKEQIDAFLKTLTENDRYVVENRVLPRMQHRKPTTYAKILAEKGMKPYDVMDRAMTLSSKLDKALGI